MLSENIAIVLLRVFKNRRGVIPFVTTFASRATGTPFSDDSGVAWCTYEFVHGRIMKCRGALEVLMTIAVTTFARVPDIFYLFLPWLRRLP